MIDHENGQLSDRLADVADDLVAETERLKELPERVDRRFASVEEALRAESEERARENERLALAIGSRLEQLANEDERLGAQVSDEQERATREERRIARDLEREAELRTAEGVRLVAETEWLTAKDERLHHELAQHGAQLVELDRHLRASLDELDGRLTTHLRRVAYAVAGVGAVGFAGAALGVLELLG